MRQIVILTKPLMGLSRVKYTHAYPLYSIRSNGTVQQLQSDFDGGGDSHVSVNLEQVP